MAAIASLCVTACNKDDDVTSGTDNYVASESVAVTAFSLSADLRVMKNLDSVYFSIDLEHGVIFNADSLPKGTPVTKLIPKITYPSSVKTASITMSGGENRTGTVNYLANPTDTIDFTGDVTLTLGTANNAVTKTYTLKVNVHKEDPDTLYWDRLALSSLPSRLINPAAQKTVNYLDGGALCMVEESDGSYTVAVAEDIFKAQWTKEAVTLGFTPEIRTLRSDASGTLYILSTTGELYTSTDTTTWTQAASGWNEVIGMYGQTLLGIAGTAGAQTMVSYPSGNIAEMALPQDFPQYGFSEPIEFTNRWTPYPTIVIVGGYPYPSDGNSAVWGFDGTTWTNLAEKSLPALEGLAVVDYYSYLSSDSNSLLREFEVYLAFGGRLSDGTTNRTVYVSYDHGINWFEAQNYLQLPPEIATGYQLDALAIGTPMQSNLSDRWRLVKKDGRSRLPFQVDGDVIKWECPYIFLFGGLDQKNVLNSEIRSGVLQRLTFVPLF